MRGKFDDGYLRVRVEVRGHRLRSGKNTRRIGYIMVTPLSKAKPNQAISGTHGIPNPVCMPLKIINLIPLKLLIERVHPKRRFQNVRKIR